MSKNRRSLRSGTVAGAAVLAISLTACGVGGSSGPKLKGFDDKVLQSTTPAAKGTISSFTWDLPFGEPGSLDPIKAYGYSENTVLANVCDALFQYGPDQKIVPDLATSVAHPSATSWVYTIRQGVHYFNGKLMTAADVVYNIRRHMDASLGSYYYSSFGSKIASVTQTGPDQVTMTTKTPNSIPNQEMVTGLGTIVDPASIQASGKNFGSSSGQLNCTGAFEFQKWTPGDSIVLKKNPNYWNKALEPKASSVTFEFISDQNALTNALVSGQVDGSYGAPVSAVSQLRSSSTGKFYLGHSLSELNMLFFGNPVTNDIKIRRALYETIDRASIAKIAYSGTALPIKSLLNPDSNNFGQSIIDNYYNSLPEPGPDLAKAKDLVKQAGGAPTTPLRLAILAGDTAQAKTAQIVQADAAQVGFKVQIDTVPPNQYLYALYDPASSRKKWDLALAISYYDVPDINTFFGGVFLPGQVANVFNYNNAAFNEAFKREIAESDPNKRAQDIVTETKQLDRDLPYLGMLDLAERLYMNNKITGAPVSFPSYLYYPWAALVGSAS